MSKYLGSNKAHMIVKGMKNCHDIDYIVRGTVAQCLEYADKHYTKCKTISRLIK